jgi:Golgi apparatus protein 1
MVELISDDNLQESSHHACGTDLNDVGCKASGRNGVLLACMIEHRESIKSVPCQAFIQRMEWVAFSDFRLITHFTDDCREDIRKTECGRMQIEKVCMCNIIVFAISLEYIVQ